MTRLAAAGALAAIALVAGCGGERAGLMRAYDAKEKGKAALSAGRAAECVEHYAAAAKEYQEFADQHASQADQKHWWAEWYLAETAMQQAQCRRAAGDVPGAIAALEPAVKRGQEALAGDCCTAESIKNREKAYLADMNEALAKWKKEAER